MVQQQQPILGQEHQSLEGRKLYQVHELGQQPADHNQTYLQAKSCDTITIRDHTTQLLLTIAIQISHK